MGFIFARIAVGLLQTCSMLILIRCVVSFFPQYRYNKLVTMLFRITEPVLAPVRVLLWRINALRNIPFDLSPVAVMLAIQVLIGIISFSMSLFLPYGGFAPMRRLY